MAKDSAVGIEIGRSIQQLGTVQEKSESDLVTFWDGTTRHRSHMELFHCMVQHGTVQYGSLLGGLPLGTVPGTWYCFSTTSAGVPSDPYRYQNVTCKLH